jgi:MerR family transcriptional regulator/heat shock protein HspR
VEPKHQSRASRQYAQIENGEEAAQGVARRRRRSGAPPVTAHAAPLAPRHRTREEASPAPTTRTTRNTRAPRAQHAVTSSDDGAQTTARPLLNDPDYPRYGIGVVSDLTGIPAQQMRRYEKAGLIEPHRTAGRTRQYSDADVGRLLEIGQLMDEGVNVAGIQRILHLRTQLAARKGNTQSTKRKPTGSDRRRRGGKKRTVTDA